MQGHHEDRGTGYDDNGSPVSTEGFNFAAVDIALGNDPEVSARDQAFEIASEMLGGFLRFISDATSLEAAGRRAFASIYALRPDLLRGRNLTVLAADLETTKQSLSAYVTDLRDFSGLLFRSMHSKSERASRSHRGMSRAGKPQTARPYTRVGWVNGSKHSKGQSNGTKS